MKEKGKKEMKGVENCNKQTLQQFQIERCIEFTHKFPITLKKNLLNAKHLSDPFALLTTFPEESRPENLLKKCVCQCVSWDTR